MMSVFSPLTYAEDNDAPTFLSVLERDLFDDSLFTPISPFTPPPASSSSSDTVDVRRLRHRHRDNERRRRENEALNKLTAIIESTAQTRTVAKRDRLSVLEAAIAAITSLQQRRDDSDDVDVARSTKRRRDESGDSARRSALATRDDIAAESAMTHETFFSSAFTSASALQLTINADTGTVLAANRAFIDFTGYDLADFIGRRVEPTRREWLTKQSADVDDTSFIKTQVIRSNGHVVALRKPPRSADDKRAMSELYRGLVPTLELYSQHAGAGGSASAVRRICWLSKVQTPAQSAHDRSHVTLLHYLVLV